MCQSDLLNSAIFNIIMYKLINSTNALRENKYEKQAGNRSTLWN